MQKVLTAAQMREVDRLTTERYGIPSIILMENAAHAVARVITEKLGGSVKGKSILVLCGKGNNGGDGAALARILWTGGAEVSVVLFGKIEDAKGDALINFKILKSISRFIVRKEFDPYDRFEAGQINFWEESNGEHFRKRYRPVKNPHVVVDAIFGTGLSRPLDENTYQILTSNWFADKEERDSPFTLISIDLPTGLMGKTEWGSEITFTADVTVALTAPKPDNVLPPFSSYHGELVIANIGSPDDLINEILSQLFVTEKEDVQGLLDYGLNFESDDYKNKRGHALVVAGSQDYSGAAVLAGNAAMRSGVGLVTLACPAEAKAEIASRLLPDVILKSIEKHEATELVADADAVAVGCGLDANDSTVEKFIRNVVETRTIPVIVDAGALWFYSPFEANKPNDSEHPLILTPHEGEFMRLLGETKNHPVGETPPPLLRKEGSFGEDRVAAVRDFATKHNVILVLKGERVLIGAPDGRVVVNPTGNSGLGKAGNGDTLTGILAGFVAQAAKMNIDVFETVVAAVYIAGMAGDVAEKKYGKRVMTASDVRECLVEVFATFEERDEID